MSVHGHIDVYLTVPSALMLACSTNSTTTSRQHVNPRTCPSFKHHMRWSSSASATRGMKQRIGRTLSISSHPSNQTPKDSVTTLASRCRMQGRAEGQAGACLRLVAVHPTLSQHLIPVRGQGLHLLLQLLLLLLLADMQGCLAQRPEGLCLVAPCMRLMPQQAEVSLSLQQGRARTQLHMVVRKAMQTLLGMGVGVAGALRRMLMVTGLVTGVMWVLEVLSVVAMVLMVQQVVTVSFRGPQAGVPTLGQMLLHTLPPLIDLLGQHSGADCEPRLLPLLSLLTVH